MNYLNKKHLILLTIALFFLMASGCSQTNNTSVVENCTKTGNAPATIDMTTGKPLPGGESCCEGLKAIGPKTDSETLKKGICAMVASGPLVCAPCGNNVCDAEHEDRCNCPEDCQ